MNRQSLTTGLGAAGVLVMVGLAAAAFWRPAPEHPLPQRSQPKMSDAPHNARPTIVKSDAEWRQELSPEAYHVAREKGTERAFTGKYWNNKEEGLYTCVCCGTPLFESTTKFESGTGWPSFWKPVDGESVATESDRTLWMERTEVTCRNCGAHLGHVFEDGPAPTGLRYCMNSASLNFEPKATSSDAPPDKNSTAAQDR